MKSRWLGLVRELGPRQRHLVQDATVALALDLFGQAPAFLGKAAILCGRVHLWRQPGRPLMRSGCMRVMPPGTFSTGAGCVARKLGMESANSVCSPPPCGEGVGVAVILLGSSSSMPSTLESSTPRLLASLRLAYLQLLSCGHLFVSLLRPPPLAPPQPAAGLLASGKHKSDQPRQAGVGLGEGNAPIMRQLS